MKQVIKSLILSLALMMAPLALAGPVNAAFDGGIRGGVEAARADDQPEDLFGDSGIFKKITNIMLFMVGILSVIMLIIGGMHYVISGGKKESVTAAKNTILYAIVGLVVSLLAFAIINFILNVFVGEGAGYGTTNV